MRLRAKSLRPKCCGLVLNDYDQGDQGFSGLEGDLYRGRIRARSSHQKSGIDFGQIIDLIPLHRGASGRIDSLKIVGTKHTEIIGKELKIRYWLSKTCLYSSWFEVKINENGVWTLHRSRLGSRSRTVPDRCSRDGERRTSNTKKYFSYYYVGSQDLALQRNKYKHLTDDEWRWFLQQVEGRERTADKLPTFAAIDDWWYPVRLSCEQCSSEAYRPIQSKPC